MLPSSDGLLVSLECRSFSIQTFKTCRLRTIHYNINNMMPTRQRIWFARILAIACISILVRTESALGRPRFSLLVRNQFLFGTATRQSSLLARGEENSLSADNKIGFSFISQCRGGANGFSSDFDDEDDDDEEYDEEEEEEYDDDDESAVESSSREAPISTLISTLTSVSKAIVRGVKAAFQSLEPADDSDNDASLFERVVQMCQSFWTAAIHPEDSTTTAQSTGGSKPSKASKSNESKESNADATYSDFGTYLAQAYGVADSRNLDDSEVSKPSPVLGGSLNEALKIARSNARLLVVLIPSAAPKSNKKSDIKAIKSFLSSEVAAVAKKKARKKGETGSFLLWGAKAGSSEATQAMKRLKVKQKNSKGDKIPILLVAYPAQVIAKGVPKIAPKVLAQHHCSPPPSTDAMAQWMNELRKRHAKQFASMQKEVREAELYKERKEGYKESVQSDVERKIREKKEEEERLAKEKAEQERVAALERRREELLESLPEEPGKEVKDATTLSIRLADGRSDKRRFTRETQLSVVFNWVDASFQMEREAVVLTTMNGKQTFSWDDAADEKTLADAGLGRMVGFRVTERKSTEDSEENGKESSKEEA